MKQDILYIVVPCYNEQEVLPITTPKLIEQLNALVEAQLIDKESRILYVNDGSIDDTWQLIEQYTQQHPQVCGVKLAGNVGHQNALLAGLEAASERADITISIDADLQDDVAVMRDMVQKYHEGCDIVYGVRRERKTDTWFKRNSALAFYKLMRRLGVKSVYNHADYRLMSRRAVKQLLNYRERNLFLRGIVPLVGYKTDSVFYDRSERLAGESKYPLSKMINFAVNGITSFSIKPVRMVLTLGIIFTLIALGILVYVLIAYFSGRTVSGWASLILSLWFIGGCVLIGLGIVGEYIGKIYIEVKDRPRYNIEKEIIQ
ncbi:MAG: glycosyltransferase family 2 protein [Muribaculaceae bacterium]|nr:glycosyltransferase family 2 protein [Muribaculaceae bacterium]MBQ3961203.1 glycosyltransferase family 2 protein [Muribaculaceae bacterium]